MLRSGSGQNVQYSDTASDVDPHRSYADPDPQTLVNADPDPDLDPGQKITKSILNHLLKVKKKKNIFKSVP